MTSEVARLREQYELEYQAAKRAQELQDLVSPHQFITKRMETMWEQLQRICQEVGQEEAKRIVFGKPIDLSEPQ